MRLLTSDSEGVSLSSELEERSGEGRESPRQAVPFHSSAGGVSQGFSFPRVDFPLHKNHGGSAIIPGYIRRDSLLK